MQILFFDTETTGFPTSGDLDSQPYIVQIAGMLFEHSNGENKEYCFDNLFKAGIPIPLQVTQIHGISDDMVKDKQLLCESKFITEFMQMMSKADIICGHNVQFDFKLIFIEIERALQSFPEKLEKFPKFKQECLKKGVCTMMASVDICKLPGKYGSYKWPKLMELHKHLFDSEFDDAHNALNDIMATRKCFFELIVRGTIKLDKTA